MNASITLWQKYMQKSLVHTEEIFGFLIQPILWVVLFGVGMRGMFSEIMAGENSDYITFMLPGIIALTAIDGSIGGGSTWLNERLRGMVKEYLVAPIPRLSILLGNALAIITRSVAQALLILLVGILMGAKISGNPLHWLMGLVFIFGYGLGFSGIALALASATSSMGAYHSLIFILNLPMLFLSNALYPLFTLPSWMRIAALINPTTYVISGMRQSLLRANSPLGETEFLPLWLCFVVIGVFAALGMGLALRAFQRNVK
ncbi:MAG: ABC transporter permease [Ardenticatenaceae bacterium]|nr:ABC transporter permease [Ardenticatenaceae bacterium]MCB8948376.1 ABC transporter permease [Ardenticatenaceae bacterium]